MTTPQPTTEQRPWHESVTWTDRTETKRLAAEVVAANPGSILQVTASAITVFNAERKGYIAEWRKAYTEMYTPFPHLKGKFRRVSR